VNPQSKKTAVQKSATCNLVTVDIVLLIYLTLFGSVCACLC